MIRGCFDRTVGGELIGRTGGPLTMREAAGLRLLGAQVKRARYARGWTQRRLEEVSGVDQTTISRLENGRLINLRLVRLAALAGALDGAWWFDVGESSED
jgi:DNA-binding Xre family transcriptional regulator